MPSNSNVFQNVLAFLSFWLFFKLLKTFHCPFLGTPLFGKTVCNLNETLSRKKWQISFRLLEANLLHLKPILTNSKRIIQVIAFYSDCIAAMVLLRTWTMVNSNGWGAGRAQWSLFLIRWKLLFINVTILRKYFIQNPFDPMVLSGVSFDSMAERQCINY